MKRTYRTAAEEWQPHQAQGDGSAEWWNLTAAVCDPAGPRYFLSWTVIHPGRRHLGHLAPQVVAQIRPGYNLYAGRFVLISELASIRKAGVPAVFVMNDHEVWDEETSALRLRDAQDEHECAWSFDGERMDLAMRSPALGFNLNIQVWAGDQAGPARHRADSGGSYSLPRLQITGSVTYPDERGKPVEVEVSGTGWADRQWGDFDTDQGWWLA
jgi:predicted secreted hydrolase